MIVRRKSDELYHHGVEGQSWGKRHGPPYPLDSNSSKQAARKRKAAAKAARKQSKRDKKKAEQEKKTREGIKKALEDGDLKAVNKYKSKMTNDELRTAIERLNLMMKIKDLNSDDSQRKMRAARTYIGTVRDVVGTAADATRLTRDVDKFLNPKESKKKKQD
jgi:hypothetical protein